MGDLVDGWQDWTKSDAQAWIRVPGEEDDKYSRGVLGVITGSDLYPGAAVLGVEAAMRTGIGMVRYLGGTCAQDFVLQRRPEVVTASGRVQAWLVGSGLDAASRATVTTTAIIDALGAGLPAVIDAGALDLFGSATGPTVITPHFRELAGVLKAHGEDVSAEQIGADPSDWAIRASELFGTTVLLKGHTTYVVSPGGLHVRVSFGPSWLATAGSGDVLGGILGALVATHSDEIAADADALARLAATASALHGLAAERASDGGPIAALDIAEAVPRTIAGLLSSGERPLR